MKTNFSRMTNLFIISLATISFSLVKAQDHKMSLVNVEPDVKIEVLD